MPGKELSIAGIPNGGATPPVPIAPGIGTGSRILESAPEDDGAEDAVQAAPFVFALAPLLLSLLLLLLRLLLLPLVAAAAFLACCLFFAFSSCSFLSS